MKKKILNIAVDIILIMIMFGVTDWITANVWKTERIVSELLTYLVAYALVFGCKSLILYLWNKKCSDHQ